MPISGLYPAATSARGITAQSARGGGGDTIPICMDFKMGKCTRSSCRYAHQPGKLAMREERSYGVIRDVVNLEAHCRHTPLVLEVQLVSGVGITCFMIDIIGGSYLLALLLLLSEIFFLTMAPKLIK